MDAPPLVDPRARPRVFVVCNDEPFLERLTQVLGKAEIALAARARAVEDLVVDDDEGAPVVILALDATPTARASAIRNVRERYGHARIVTCNRAAGSEVRRALHAGADGYVLRARLEETLHLTVAAVRADQIAVPRDERVQVGAPKLSPREKQILGMVVMGYMNCDIAQRLFLAESTVKSHLSSAFLKLGVRSRTEAVDLILDPEQGLGRGILAITTDVSEPPLRGQVASPSY